MLVATCETNNYFHIFFLTLKIIHQRRQNVDTQCNTSRLIDEAHSFGVKLHSVDDSARSLLFDMIPYSTEERQKDHYYPTPSTTPPCE